MVAFQVAVNNIVTTQKETVMVDKEITDRSMLSNSTASLCSRSRIFQVAQLPSGQIKVTKRNPHESKCSETRKLHFKLCFCFIKFFNFKPCTLVLLFSFSPLQESYDCATGEV